MKSLGKFRFSFLRARFFADFLRISYIEEAWASLFFCVFSLFAFCWGEMIDASVFRTNNDHTSLKRYSIPTFTKTRKRERGRERVN